MSELKPCPFCGGEGGIVVTLPWRIYTVQCRTCFAMVGRDEKTVSGLRGNMFFQNESDAVAALNSRTLKEDAQ